MGQTTRRGRRQRKLNLVNEDAAGLDVGATFPVAAVPPERDTDSVHTFRSFTADLHALARWLQSVGIRTIVASRRDYERQRPTLIEKALAGE
jgi:hypothetical protein